MSFPKGTVWAVKIVRSREALCLCVLVLSLQVQMGLLGPVALRHLFPTGRQTSNRAQMRSFVRSLLVELVIFFSNAFIRAEFLIIIFFNYLARDVLLSSHTSSSVQEF